MTGLATPMCALAVAMVMISAPHASGSARAGPTGGAVDSDAASSAKGAVPPVRLSLPITCEPGITCFVQSHVDRDPGPGSRDHRCGSATYDGHKGVDFRILSASAAREGVAVLASAEGIVKGTRGDMSDALLERAADAPGARVAVAGRECGNGVLIAHGGGWETQYCHMLEGSVTVQTGDRVARGQKLGLVGYSGLAQFAHVHLAVRHAGKVVDPFTGLARGERCPAAGEQETLNGAAPPVPAAIGLWDEAASAAFPYRNGEIIGAGFTAGPVATMQLEADHRVAVPQPEAPSLMVYARVANMRAGDRLRIVLAGPEGFSVDQTSAPLDRNKAIFVGFAGQRRTAARWPEGRYTGRVELLRGGAIIQSRQATELVMR